MTIERIADAAKRNHPEIYGCCICEHIAFIHRDKGKGACEGVITYFDQMGDPDWFKVEEPCPCGRFDAAP